MKKLGIKGKEKIGAIPVDKVKASVAEAHSTEKDIAFYTTDAGAFYVAEPGTFFVMTTQDAHNPSNKTEDYEAAKKVVVKVKNIW